MKLTKDEWLFGAGRRIGLGLLLGQCLMGMALGSMANAQAVSTTTVQGTVYLANGAPGAGTLNVSWPAFTTANGQSVAAGKLMLTIAPDGFVSVNLAPNVGAIPAGLYYTAVYHMSDGTTSTEYWVVPAAAQASLGQVQAQLMPAAQAVQAVSKAYVDQAITELTESLLTASGGTLSGPLYLNGDPTQPLQAADKHYVDTTFNMEVPIAGGNMTGPLTTPSVNGVQSPEAASSQTTLQAAVTAAGSTGAVEIPPNYAGTDTFTNLNGVYVADLRRGNAQQFERSVKEFGAVCDGATDDTNALQSGLNYAQTHGVALTIPQGTCKTRALNWHGESIGGLGKQVSALMGFPGQDVLVTTPDSMNLLSYTRLHDLTIYVDQSLDVSCSAAEGRAPAGSCAVSRPLESNSIFSPGGSGLTGTVGTGTAWAVGNCAIAMPAATGAGGNGLRVAEIENLEIAATGVDPMAQYAGAHSTHTCGLYLGQWPQWSEFRNIDIRGLNTGIAIPALPGTAPAGLNSDSNRWQNITIQATHGFTAAAGSNNVLDNVVAMAGNSAATAEPPTGLVLDFAGAQQGWTVRNAVVLPVWNAVQPQLTVTASGGAVTGVTVGSEHGLGFDPYGTQVPLTFSGSCTAQATASVNSNGSIGTVTVTSGGVGCSGTTTASVNVAGTWDTAAPVNLISGQNMSLLGGNLLKGNGGYTVWNAASSQNNGTQLDGGGGTLPGGGSYPALVANNPLGSAYQVDQFPGADFGAKLQSCLQAVSAIYGGTCDARNFTGNLSMGSNLTISTANATVLLPCATISTANQLIVTARTRNVALRGCALRGASTASGSQGGTVFLYSGTGAMVQVGDPTYATDTSGFHMDNAVINTTTATSATAQGLVAYRTQEMYLESLYLLGNQNQTGMTLDGTGNYTGGSFFGNQFSGFQTAVNAIGHQIANPATGDWMNASTFVRLHIDCPTSGGSPISGTYGINLQQGDGNTFTGGDVEGCNTALHLGANAVNNTIVGLRNENSTNQVVADAGSSYNNWMTGGTMYTGALTDNGTRNSFLDTFHRSFNGLNGDWYGSQKDATVTNHYRIGIGTGNERGLLDRYQTDYGYRWTMGLSDAAAGEQFYQVLDELNNVYRLSIGQYNNGQTSTNNQTVINSAGTGAVVLNGSNNSGTGGVVIGSGGASETTVATINNAGNAQFIGTLQVGGTSTLIGTPTVKNQADAEIDAILWAGLTTSQKESLIYKDWNGNSQWYAEKDASNNWELNSATGGLDSFKAYQSTNSGDTYINASNSSGAVRVNYETGAGTGFKVYGGSSSSLYASLTGTTSIMFPGLAASSGHNCLQVDSSGYLTNTGSACGTGSGGSGTVNSGTAGQIGYYSAAGTAVSGMSTVPVTAGGTGAATAAGAVSSLLPGVTSNGTNGIGVAGAVAAATTISDVQRNGTYWYDVRSKGAACNGTMTGNTWSGTDDTAAFVAAFNNPSASGIEIPPSSGYCSVLPGQLIVPGGNIYATITGVAIASRIQDETNTGSGSNAPILQIGTSSGALSANQRIRGFALLGAYGVSYPNGLMLMYQNNLSTFEDLILSLPTGATNSYGLMTSVTASQVFQEMRFNRISVYGHNSAYNTGMFLQSNMGNVDIRDSNIEDVATGMDFSGNDGTPLLDWSGGHLERIGTTAFRIRQAQLYLRGAEVEWGNIYLDSSSVGSDISISGGSKSGPVFIDNGVGNRFYAGASSGGAWQQALNLDGSEQYKTPNTLPDPVFLVSGTSGWSKSSSHIALTAVPLTSPGARAGQAIQISDSTSASDYAYITTPTLTASGEYELVLVFYFNTSSAPAPTLSVYDTASSTTIYGPVTVTPTMAVPAAYAQDWAYAVQRVWLPASSSVSTWQIRVSPNNATGAPVTLTYDGLNPSSTTMASAVTATSGGGTATCTAASPFSSYLSATCALSGGGSSAAWTLSAPAYPTGAFLRVHVSTDANAVSPWVTINGSFRVDFPAGLSSQDYNIPLGFWPATISFEDYYGVVTDPNDMVISQLSVVPMYQYATAPVPNSQLANSSTTVNGQTCTLGSSCSIAASNLSNGVSGSGAVALVSAPTFTGNTTTFANGAASEDDVAIQPGSGTDQVGALEFNSYGGTDEWKLRKDASNYLRLTDVVNSLDREVFYQNGATIVNAGAGSGVVGINNTSGSGTGGLIVYGGGANYSTAELTVTGSGNTTANGFMAGKFMIGEGTMSMTAGTAAGTSPTIACASSHVCDGVSGTVALTTGTGTTTGTLATLSFPNTHTNNANCVVMPTLSGTGLVTAITWSESTTALTLTANTALTASTAYQIRYWCGGN
ncbi:MAG: beta strand repeat-containing protein [Bryobacteraceae bacterium]